MSEKIKVAFYVFFRGGGIGLYTVKLLRSLESQSGLKLQLACSPEFDWQKYKQVRVTPIMMPLAHKIPIIRRCRFLLAQWVNPFRLIKQVTKDGVQIVHFSSYNFLTYPFWGKKLRDQGVKVVVSAHDVLRQKAILCRSWENRQLAAFYHNADAILVHSEFQAKQLEEFASVTRDKVHLVPHGPYDYPPPSEAAEQLRKRYGVPADACLGLFFGQLRDEKNLEGLLRALPRRDKTIHLLIAGKGGGRHKNGEYYQKLASDLGVSEQVTIVDRFIDDSEIGGLFTMADWLALPYDDTFVSQSGVLNIAGAYDVPILVGDAPVLRETVERENIGIAATFENLQIGVEEIVSAVRTGRQFGFQSYRDKHKWSENARITSEVYHSLVG
jgi:glycosyltransferase involved in cell wall biosynthesis